MSDMLPGTGPVTVTAEPGQVTVTVRNVVEWRRLMYGQRPLSDIAAELREARQIAFPD